MSSSKQNKTVATKQSVDAFIASVQPEQRREDCKTIMRIMYKVTGKQPVMWGSSMVGYGQYHYKYESGREGDMLATGFSPRKTILTLYIMPGYQDYSHFLQQLGQHKTGKSCLYLKSLEKVNLVVLEDLIKTGYNDLVTKYPVS